MRHDNLNACVVVNISPLLAAHLAPTCGFALRLCVGPICTLHFCGATYTFLVWDEAVPRVLCPITSFGYFVDDLRELSDQPFNLRKSLNCGRSSIRIDLGSRIPLKYTIILQPSTGPPICSDGAAIATRPGSVACERHMTMALNQQSENSVVADPASDKVVPDGTGKKPAFFNRPLLTSSRRGRARPLAITIQRCP